MNNRLPIAGLVTAVTLVASPASGQSVCPAPSGLIAAPTASATSGLGFAMDYGGGTLAVTARFDNAIEPEAGRVFLYELVDGTWELTATLEDPDGETEDLFGQWVDVSPDGNTVLVTAMWAETGVITNAGSSVLYTKNNGIWEYSATIPSPVPDANGWFGTSAVIDSQTLLIGAREEDSVVGFNTGNVHVFKQFGSFWLPVQTLAPSVLTGNNHFGHAVAMHGDYAAVGAFNHSAPGTSESGAVFMYERENDTWVEKQRLFSSVPGDDDFFGVTVDIHGSTMVAGARFNTTGKDGQGAVFVFERQQDGTWVETQRISSPEPQSTSEFGSKVAIRGDLLAVADWKHLGDTGLVEGRAYVFQRGPNGFEHIYTAQADTMIDPQSSFGSHVEFTETGLVIGAAFDNSVGPGARGPGSVYWFDLACTSVCVADVNGDGSLTPADFTAWIDAFHNQTSACDQNDDSVCTPTDFSAWMGNYNTGCP